MASDTLNAQSGRYQMTGKPVQLGVLRDFALDPAGPFFDYVLTYLAASAGFTPVYDATHYPDFMAGVAGIFPGTAAGHARADLAECVRLARDGVTLPQRRAEQSLCCMLANATYESIAVSHKLLLRGHMVFEFFRHVRNAASHGNKWHFVVNARVQEPARPAEWSGIKIDDTIKGDKNPLHGTPCVYGTIQPADLLYLLRDVEALLLQPAAPQ